MNNSCTVVIYFNPACSMSRHTLALIRSCGIEPRVIDCLKRPPSSHVLQELIATAGLNVRDFLSHTALPYLQYYLSSPRWSDLQLIELMSRHPVLINAPIVVSELGTRLCHSAEQVLDILPWTQLRQLQQYANNSANQALYALCEVGLGLMAD